jgi:hypothetical protein
MVDVQARNHMASALRSYMDEEITAFALDDALFLAVASTEDQTVKQMGTALWFHYDDLTEHKVVASKEAWDYFNRILLLLESDGELVAQKPVRRWHLRQAIAAVCLVAFSSIVLLTGFGLHLLVLVIPFGLASMALAWWSSRGLRKREKAEEFVAPFSSITNLLSTRRQVAGFKKSQYPRELAIRRIRGPLLELFMMLPYGMGLLMLLPVWLMFAPLFLFFQMFPSAESKATIRILEQSDGTSV